MRQRDELNAILDCRLRARRLGGRVSLASAALAIAFSTVASAHKPSDSYLSLDATSMQGSWDIALRDLDDAIGVDAEVADALELIARARLGLGEGRLDQGAFDLHQ